MLDTNIVSDLVRNPQGRVFDKVVAYGSDNLCVSIITAAELRYACVKKGSAKLLVQVEAILAGIEILPFDVPADVEYGVSGPNSRRLGCRSARMTCSSPRMLFRGDDPSVRQRQRISACQRAKIRELARVTAG